MKKDYICPLLEIMEFDDLCQTGMNNNSYHTKTRIVADDQKDIYIEDPEIEEKPTDNPPTVWDW